MQATLEQKRVRMPIEQKGRKDVRFNPAMTVIIKTGEITVDRRDIFWRDKLLNGKQLLYDWTSLRDGELIGPGDRRNA